MIEKKRCTAIVLSAGTGSRMGGDVAKQYRMLGDKPVLWYSLQAVEKSRIIDDCILVVGAGDVETVRKDIVDKYGFAKVDTVTAGGAERYLSVGNALQVIADDDLKVPNHDGYVFIHDGARPFLTEEMLERIADGVHKYRACVAAVPAKDTVKIADKDQFAIQTPDRRTVWNIQTPQAFDVAVMQEAYERLKHGAQRLKEQGIAITDDACVVELFTNVKVRLVEGSYNNLKITTPEDMIVAEALLANIL